MKLTIIADKIEVLTVGVNRENGFGVYFDIEGSSQWLVEREKEDCPGQMFFDWYKDSEAGFFAYAPLGPAVLPDEVVLSRISYV